MAPEIDMDAKVDAELKKGSDAPKETPPVAPVKTVSDELEEINPDYSVGETYSFTNKQSTPQQTFKYTQRPIGFGAKIEFYKLLSEALRDAVNGPGGVSVGSIISALPDMVAGEEVTAESVLANVGSVDTLIGGILPLLVQAPDFVDELIVLALGVPSYERSIVKILMNDTVENGGLTDDQGQRILDTFIDQNATAMRDFSKRQAGTARRLIGHLRPKGSPGA